MGEFFVTGFRVVAATGVLNIPKRGMCHAKYRPWSTPRKVVSRNEGSIASVVTQKSEENSFAPCVAAVFDFEGKQAEARHDVETEAQQKEFDPDTSATVDDRQPSKDTILCIG